MRSAHEIRETPQTVVRMGGTENGQMPQDSDVVVDTLLPARANVRGHSFQRAMAGMTEYQHLNGLMFAANDHVITDVWSAGRHTVQAGRPIRRDKIVASCRSTMRSPMPCF